MEPTCANCGTAAPGSYCAACGQETRDPPTPAEFLRESVEHFLSLDRKTWQTLTKLLFEPGALTVEYLAGRRVRYIRPLRLYLWITVLVMALTETLGLHLGLRTSAQGGIYLFAPAAGAASTETGGFQPIQLVLGRLDTPGVRRFKAMSAEEQARIVSRHRHRSVQYFLLLLVPVCALILQLCFANRRRPYGDHLVFCLHAQSALLVLLLVETALPAILATVVTGWVIAYFVLALHRVYGGAWVDTLVRGTTTVALNLATFVGAGILFVYAALELA